MEAHRPVAPERRFREQVMGAAQVEASYTLDRGWDTTWNYTFGRIDLSDGDLALIAGTYDAAIAELDDLFAQLMAELEARGELENTVVILTSDHGEHLGEHHMLDHQYSLYDPVLRVPLVVHFPKRFKAGREARPVMSFDLHPTLLELAGIPEQVEADSRAVSLLTPREDRVRFAEYRAPFGAPFRSIRKQDPTFDASPWRRRLKTIREGDGTKLIHGGDGRHELNRTAVDPGEPNDLYSRTSKRAAELEEGLGALFTELESIARAPAAPGGPLPPADRERLEALGYGDAAHGTPARPDAGQ
jgi:arylsulfatase A-like enzyme